MVGIFGLLQLPVPAGARAGAFGCDTVLQAGKIPGSIPNRIIDLILPIDVACSKLSTVDISWR
jgi:hypothetical protein